MCCDHPCWYKCGCCCLKSWWYLSIVAVVLIIGGFFSIGWFLMKPNMYSDFVCYDTRSLECQCPVFHSYLGLNNDDTCNYQDSCAQLQDDTNIDRLRFELFLSHEDTINNEELHQIIYDSNKFINLTHFDTNIYQTQSLQPGSYLTHKFSINKTLIARSSDAAATELDDGYVQTAWYIWVIPKYNNSYYHPIQMKFTNIFDNNDKNIHYRHNISVILLNDEKCINKDKIPHFIFQHAWYQRELPQKYLPIVNKINQAIDHTCSFTHWKQVHSWYVNFIQIPQ